MQTNDGVCRLFKSASYQFRHFIRCIAFEITSIILPQLELFDFMSWLSNSIR